MAEQKIKYTPSSAMDISDNTQQELRQKASVIMQRIDDFITEQKNKRLAYDKKWWPKYTEVIALYEELQGQTALTKEDHYVYGSACFGCGMISFKNLEFLTALNFFKKAIDEFAAAKSEECGNIIASTIEALQLLRDKSYLNQFEAHIKTLGFAPEEKAERAHTPQPTGSV